MKKIPFLAVLAAAALAAGCASTERPVLYPNSHLKQVGDARAERDIDECRALAEKAGAEATDAGRATRPAVEGAAVGGAVGGVSSAIGGRNIGLGALAGAAVGGTAGGVHGAFRAGEVSPIHRNFVQRCLRDRGYEVIGWK
jgi:hypothetical protein